MSKSADAFRTISEVADWLDTPAHVLRFWESKFTQVKPVKRAGGRRYYRPADMRLLGGIKKLLHEDGMTIKGVQKILREKGIKHVSSLCALSLSEDEDLDEIQLEEVVEAQPIDTVVPFSKLSDDELSSIKDQQDAVVELELPFAQTTEEVPETIDEADLPGPAKAEEKIEDLQPVFDEVFEVEETPAAEDVSNVIAADDAQDEPIDTDEVAEAEIVVATEPEPPVEESLEEAENEFSDGVEADPIPAFLQRSMGEISEDENTESAIEVAEAEPEVAEAESPSPPLVKEPTPGALTRLASISEITADTAHHVAPIAERLRELVR